MDENNPQSFFHSDEMHKFVRTDVAGKSDDIPWRKLKAAEKENAEIKKKEIAIKKKEIADSKKKEKQSKSKKPWEEKILNANQTAEYMRHFKHLCGPEERLNFN